MPLRTQSFGLATYPPGSDFGPRHLTSFEFVWILGGDVRWDCNGQEHGLPEGSVALCRPGFDDSFFWDRQRSTQHGFVHFTGDPPPDMPGLDQWPLLRLPHETGVLMPILQHMLWLLNQDMAYQQCQVCLDLAVRCFVSGAVDVQTTPLSPHQHPIIEGMLNCIHKQWEAGNRHGPEVASLAKELGVSRGHLSRVCRQELDLSPQAVLRQLRLDHAASLLSRTNLPVQEIAELSGFESPFHFSRCFKSLYGKSPRSFRQAIASGKAPRLLFPLLKVRRPGLDGWS